MKGNDNPKTTLILALIAITITLLNVFTSNYTIAINMAGVSVLFFSLTAKCSKNKSHNKFYIPLMIVSVSIIFANGVYHYV